MANKKNIIEKYSFLLKVVFDLSTDPAIKEKPRIKYRKTVTLRVVKSCAVAGWIKVIVLSVIITIIKILRSTLHTKTR
jgi:hypothetical protein